MPHLKALHEKYKDQGLVLISIHSDKDDAKGKAKVKELGMSWPVAFDGTAATMHAFHCDSFPDYCIIDRQGKVRVCDLANSEVDRAVESLLKEKP